MQLLLAGCLVLMLFAPFVAFVKRHCDAPVALSAERWQRVDMTELNSHADVIRLWPTTSEFAKAAGTTPSNARNMLARGIIPPHFYQQVADAAQRAGWIEVTYAKLTELGRAKA